MDVKLLESDSEIAALCPVLLELRPQYNTDNLIAQIQKQRGEGYQLAYVEAEGEVLCVAGFVIGHKLAWEKHIYVDDLVSSAKHRSHGAGALLIDWLKQHGVANGCKQLHLDSGVTRHQAHRFYLREHFAISSHHFAITNLDSESA